MDESKSRGEPNKIDISRQEQQVEDIDKIIEESGYESESKNIANKVGIDREKRLKIQAEVYLK